MFICELGHATKPGEPRIRTVAEIRKREYMNPATGIKTLGWEIVKEVDLCAQHVKELRDAAEAR